jgi:hypothetical protein
MRNPHDREARMGRVGSLVQVMTVDTRPLGLAIEKARGRMAALSRKHLVAALTQPGGGSVKLRDGRLITKVEDLPPEEELAKGDPGRREAARKALTQEYLNLQKRLAALGGVSESEGEESSPASASASAPASAPAPQASAPSPSGPAESPPKFEPPKDATPKKKP